MIKSEMKKNKPKMTIITNKCKRCGKEMKLETAKRSDEDREPYTVLGKPLDLQSILRAIEIKSPTMKITDPDSVDYGVIGDITYETMYEVIQLVNLSLPIQEQEEGTLSKLLELVS